MKEEDDVPGNDGGYSRGISSAQMLESLSCMRVMCTFFDNDGSSVTGSMSMEVVGERKRV